MGAIKGQMVRDIRRFFNTPVPQTLSISGAAAASNAFGAHEVLLQTTADAFFLIDSNPTSSVAGGHFIPSGAVWAVTVDPTHKISVITSGGAGSFYISAVG
jgi:hypothetical protein